MYIIQDDDILVFDNRQEYNSFLLKKKLEENYKQHLIDEENRLLKIENLRQETLNQINDLLEYHFGENFELKVFEGLIQILLKFPEIDVTNSKNIKHKVYDFWIKIELNTKDYKLYSILGHRSKYSYWEFKRQYRWSHLAFGMFEFSKLCFGSTSLNINVAELQDDFDIDKFENLLIQLQQYVTWESLEGVPYMKISSIYTNNSYSWDGNYEDFRISYNNFIERYFDFPLVLNNNSFKVNKDNREFIEKVNQIATRYCYFDNTKNLYFKLQEDGTIDENIEFIRNNEQFKDTVLFTYKGEDVKMSIFKEERKIENLVKVACPEIINYIANQLSQKVTEFYLK